MFTKTGHKIAREVKDYAEKTELHIEGMRLGYISTLQADNRYKHVFHWVKM